MLNAACRTSEAPANAARILFVEDDTAISQLLTETLREYGYAVILANCAEEMDARLTHEAIDLVMLDIMLPGEDGFSICRRLRANSSLPIIIVTALGEDLDRILGLEIGADDYVTKPFNTRELVARVRALLRRARGPFRGDWPQPVGFAGWRLYPRERQLVSPDGARVTTTSAEFDLLLAFCQNPGRILSRDQLLDLTHSGMAGPVERSVDVHVSRVRQKIEPDPREPTLIKTVRLGGYVFTPVVEPLP